MDENYAPFYNGADELNSVAWEEADEITPRWIAPSHGLATCRSCGPLRRHGFFGAHAFFAAFSWHISGWAVLRYMASIVLGAQVLPPPAGFDLVVVVVALIVNYGLAIVYALVLAAIIHRWGFLVGLIGGALFGVAIYFINLYTLTLFYPWFFSLNSTALLII